MIYIIQVISILFAIVLAKHDAPAVLNFEFYGIDAKKQSVFHTYNFWTKFFFCVLASLIYKFIIISMFISGLLSALWIYLIFDIALNKNRPGKSWDFIGLTDLDGKRWTMWFGKRAGEIKALILLILIISINILKIFYGT